MGKYTKRAAGTKEGLPEEGGPEERPEFTRREPKDKEKKMRLLCSKTIEEQVKAYFGSAGKYKEKEPGYFTVTAAFPFRPSVLRVAYGNGDGGTYLKTQKTRPVLPGIPEDTGQGI